MSRDAELAARLLVATNKCRVYRIGSDAIRKQYTNRAAERAAHEFAALRHLRRAFGEGRAHAGWQYRAVEPLALDTVAHALTMSAAPGATLSERVLAHPGDAYHAGAWLGTYHAHTERAGHAGVAFGDYTVHNVLIDPDARIVTALDPGMTFSLEPTPLYEDVAIFVYSVCVLALRARTGPSRVLRAFARGYRETTPLPFSRGAYIAAVGHAVRTIHAAKRRQRGLAHAVPLALLSTAAYTASLALIPALSARSAP